MVTREDVARKAGVSVSAVSRAMNGRGYVAKDKKESIFYAARELGYRANPVNAPSVEKTRQICFYNTNPYSMFYLELFLSMTKYAANRGYTLFLFTTFAEETKKTMQMDGMIVESEAVALELQETLGKDFLVPMVSASYGIPVVKTDKIPYVDADTYDALEMGIHYLMKMGHKKIAYATPFVHKNSKTVQSRNIAFENTMKPILGKEFARYFIVPEVEEGKPSTFLKEYIFEKGMQGADIFYEKKCDATALICFNDEYAWGMITRLQQLGYQVPEDISVMGIDGVENHSQSELQLTSIALDIEKQAKACVDTLIHKIEGKTPSYFTSIKPFLKEGNSVKEKGERHGN